MDTIEFKDIPLMDFGNKIVIRGIVLTNVDDDSSFIAVLPQKNVDPNNLKLLKPSLDDWHKLFEQQDYNFVKGELNGEKIILRKSQRNIDGTISWKVFRRDNYECRYCAIDNVPFTVDHIVLWEKGGATHVDNLVCACKKCNKTRGNMSYENWLESDYYKDKSQYLTEEVKAKNLELLANFDTLPRVTKMRKR